MTKIVTSESFIEMAIERHGHKYQYDLVNYKKRSEKVEILCEKHGSFWQSPGNHLCGRGCPTCGNENRRAFSNFHRKAIEVHDDLYDYSEAEYSDSKTPITIICKTHGRFLQLPVKHIYGHGCPKCGGTSKLDPHEFIEKSIIVHGNKYDYSKVNYTNHCTKVEINCELHGSFAQTPNSHLRGEGCPKCRSSKGEKRIRDFLNIEGVSFSEQARFPECKDKRPLPFDFLIDPIGSKKLIEYHGEQHYILVNYSGDLSRSRMKFEKTTQHDAIKKKWCEENQIPFLVISYLDDIEEKIKYFIDRGQK